MSVNSLKTVNTASVQKSGLVQQYQTVTTIARSVLALLPYESAIEFGAIPLALEEHKRLSVLVADSINAMVLQQLQMVTGCSIQPTVAPRDQVLALIREHYRQNGQESASATQTPQKKQPRKTTFDLTGSTTTLVDDFIHAATQARASDIHFEPFEREMIVRFRVDGVLQEMSHVPGARIAEVASRIKIMSSMDIAEKRRSQDGKIRFSTPGSPEVDIRVSTMPTDFGEKIVLRLLDKGSQQFALETLGMEPKRLTIFKKAIAAPNGIILITGPTGSGKTTTLYGVIKYLKKPDINISTVEDPIEYNIPGVNQTQVKASIGQTFANTLRTLLRQDPDVIMIGEMRDQETAEIAIRSSLTGHLVLSTLHTNDAPAAITRLVDMGIEPYLVSSSVSMIIAQRLVRKNCSKCSCVDTVTSEAKESIGLKPDVKLYKGIGCPACSYTGYAGRLGLFEVLPITDDLRRLINQKAITGDLRTQALAEGMTTLQDHALQKLISGETSFDEVLREISVLS